MRWMLHDAMRWVHTWGGIITGLVLMIAFLMGSIAVFDDELDRWMMPDTRLPAMTEQVSLDRIIQPLIQQLAPPDARQVNWWAVLPDVRNPVIKLGLYGKPFANRQYLIDPHSGHLLPDPGTLGAREFFYRMHYSLLLRTANMPRLGVWLVGFAAMTMLVCIVSGIIIHVRIFKDFFTYRAGKNRQRSLLDLHNLAGVLVLPFHIMITFSGLVIFFTIYLPSAIQTLYSDGETSFYRQQGYYDRPPAMRPAPQQASLDSMARQATHIFNDAISVVHVHYSGDANAYVGMYPSGRNSIGSDGVISMYFDGSSGAVLQTTSARPVSGIQQFIVKLHIIEFDKIILRWLYFLGGLTGCVVIATGMLYWLEKRRIKHMQQQRYGTAIVAGIALASVTGLPLATLAMLLANQLLPHHITGRQWIEVIIFVSSCLFTMAHGIIGALWHNGSLPWRTQCRLITVLALGCVAANALGTGDHLLRTIARGDWAVAGTDLVLLATAAGAAYISRHLSRRQRN